MIDVGSHVVCINDDPWILGDVPPGIKLIRNLDGLTKGVVYTVRSVFTNPVFKTKSIRLQEIVRGPVSERRYPDIEAGFDIDRFRPLKKLKVEDFVNVKEPA